MVESLDQLPPSKALLLDITRANCCVWVLTDYPLVINGSSVVSATVPVCSKSITRWMARSPGPRRPVRQAATVHLGGSLDEIAASERLVGKGEHPEKPYILLAQQSLFDPSRAPPKVSTPPGRTATYRTAPQFDMTERIEAQIERYAPGFRDVILQRSTRNTAQLEAYNPNYVGGDIVSGTQDLRQLYTRPVPRLNPYVTPLKNVYLCSASTPPGGGVHGMCGYYAAKTAIKNM